MSLRLFGIAALAAAMLAGAGEAQAGECHRVCATGKRVCVQAASQARRACKEDCRAAGSIGGCRDACRGAFSQAKTTCKGALAECHDVCTQPGGGGGGEHPCASACGAQARTCVDPLHDGLVTCGRTCLGTAHTSAEACGHNLACLLQVARDLGGCLHQCADTIHDSGEACFQQLRSCLNDCGCPGGSAGGGFPGCGSAGGAHL